MAGGQRIRNPRCQAQDLRRGTQCPCLEVGTESSPVSKRTDWTLRKVYEEMTLRIFWKTQKYLSPKCWLGLESTGLFFDDECPDTLRPFRFVGASNRQA